ncbi:MAG TPA: helicase HerA-like domain-containing protein [Bacteroidia bacterium]|nr:helicase HerA-like domain-containing protein [Bacteroidia bacterium]
MTDKATFIQRIQQSYSSKEAHIYLGAGVLNNEILAEAQINLPLRMMNRHGLVAGATGTGKTRTLQVLAEQLSDAGVPVFLLDVKGDLSGLNAPGTSNPKLEERAKNLGITFNPQGFPVEVYSLSGKNGATMRATVLEFGPVLLSKVLELNETQTGTLAVLFKYADDHKLPLVDLNDLKKVLNYLAEGPGKEEIKESYGKISTATSGTILRKIVALEQQGVDRIFGEPSFDIDDLFQKVDGKGVISLLNISDTQSQPALFSTFLLSLLVEIYNSMPEAGDLDKPKLVFFFDEAHLLFKDAPKAFLDQIEQVVRLIRSKGIGVFFCTQSPQDIPETVLAQLGNRVQHALRAFTPNDADNLRKTVKTYPRSDFYTIDECLTTLGIGQALVTVLNEKGIPTEVAVTHLTPPRAIMGPLPAAELQQLIAASEMQAKYGETVDPVSAHEILTERVNARQQQEAALEEKEVVKKTGNGRREKSAVEEVLSSPVAKEIGRQVVRGLFGMLFGSPKRRR